MSELYPLFPRLSEEGALEAEKIVERFKDKFKRAAEECLGEIYCDIPAYIESDAWTNFRNDLMAGFRNYGNHKLQADYDFKAIRQQIYVDFRDDIIKDLDQDNLEKIKNLEEEVKRLREILDQRNRYP